LFLSPPIAHQAQHNDRKYSGLFIFILMISYWNLFGAWFLDLGICGGVDRGRIW